MISFLSLQRGCPYKGRFVGRFNFRAYQAVIAVGVLLFLSNSVYLLHHSLPSHSPVEKLLSGNLTAERINPCFSPDDRVHLIIGVLKYLGNSVALCCLLVDGISLLLAVGSLTAATVIYQAMVPMQLYLRQAGSNNPITVEIYYTLSTAYTTYSTKVALVYRLPLCPRELVMLFL
jgi:hypothetical protein